MFQHDRRVWILFIRRKGNTMSNAICLSRWVWFAVLQIVNPMPPLITFYLGCYWGTDPSDNRQSDNRAIGETNLCIDGTVIAVKCVNVFSVWKNAAFVTEVYCQEILFQKNAICFTFWMAIIMITVVSHVHFKWVISLEKVVELIWRKMIEGISDRVYRLNSIALLIFSYAGKLTNAIIQYVHFLYEI